MALKVCAGCFGNFAPQDLKDGRCLPCRRAKERARGTRTVRGYDNTWLKLSANAIRQHPYCSRCGSTEDLTADHIVPRAKGGRNVFSNVQVLCRACNSAKRDRDGGTGPPRETTPSEPAPKFSRKIVGTPGEGPAGEDPPWSIA
jgi:5-methylcytosine-specific restriction endonuclease McrA